MDKGSSRDHNVILIARGETGKTNTYMSVILPGKKKTMDCYSMNTW